MLKHPWQTSLLYQPPDIDKPVVLKGTLTDLFLFQIMLCLGIFFFLLSSITAVIFPAVTKMWSDNWRSVFLFGCNISLPSLTLWNTFCNFCSKLNLKAGFKMVFSVGEFNFNLYLTVYLGKTGVWFSPCLRVVEFAAVVLCCGQRERPPTCQVISVAPGGGVFLVQGPLPAWPVWFFLSLSPDQTVRA